MKYTSVMYDSAMRGLGATGLGEALQTEMMSAQFADDGQATAPVSYGFPALANMGGGMLLGATVAGMAGSAVSGGILGGLAGASWRAAGNGALVGLALSGLAWVVGNSMAARAMGGTAWAAAGLSAVGAGAGIWFGGRRIYADMKKGGAKGGLMGTKRRKARKSRRRRRK